MKNLKQLLKHYTNHIDETNVLTAVKEWLEQKRQEYEEEYLQKNGMLSYSRGLDKLLEELNQ